MTSAALPWVKRLLKRPEYAFLCEVDESFIQNRFNLFGLDEQVPNFEATVSIVLDKCGGGGGERDSADAELFYGLVHARYITTGSGIEKMLRKYAAGQFGHCPRVYCVRSPVLPIGLHDTVGHDSARLYCPRCRDVYTAPANTPGATADGAYFGTGFPHLVFMNHPEMEPTRPHERYVAKISGFRVRRSQRTASTAPANRNVPPPSST